MKVKVTLTLDPKMWRRLRIRAAREGRSASLIIDRLIAGYLKKGGA
jgi:hypothetical protein